MSSSRKILVGLVLGVATGLFLGDHAAPFRFLADGFIRLLQMTVLPYVTVSLIAGIGSLDATTARRLFLRVGALTLVLWALALGAVFLMPLAFPELQSASFFSTTLVEERPPVDFLSLYIPSNPFHSLANSVVPAVVLFSAVLGIALMGVSGKERLIEWLQVVERALARANRLVVRLTPLGLFAIAAHAVGTLDLDQVARLRVFQLAYAAMALLLSLWVFPGLVACLTPIPARRVLQATPGRPHHRLHDGRPLHRAPHPDRALEAAPGRARRPGARGGLGPGRHRARLLQLPPRGQDALAELRALRGLVLGDGARRWPSTRGSPRPGS